MKEKGISSVVIGIINRIRNMSETKESGELPTIVVGSCRHRAQVTVAGLQHNKHFGLTLEELNEPPHSFQHAGETH